MRFASPFYLLFFAPALLLFFLFIKGRISKEAALRFSSLKIVKNAGAKRPPFQRIVPAVLRFLCFTCLILTLARPQTGTGEDKTTEHALDIVIALDLSGSMAALDFYPDDRVTVAKEEAKRFIEGRAHDRIGLVVFASQAMSVCPITFDHQAILALLDKVHLGMVEDGTAIGMGIGTAINRLKESEAKSKVVVLLTDGINNAGEISPLTAAGLAQKFGVKVYTVGVGKEGESLLPINDPQFGKRLVKIQDEIDEKTLTEIARETHGRYFRAQTANALRDIFHEIDRLEKTEITVERFTHYDEDYFWFLWPALFLLLAEIVWTNFIWVKIP